MTYDEIVALCAELDAVIECGPGKPHPLAVRSLAALREMHQSLLIAERMREWLDSNTTFYDVDADYDVEGRNIPTLAQVSARIWYHATDDTKSYPFSAVVAAAEAIKP